MLGDAVALVAHCVVGLLALALIETDVFACLRRFTFRKLPEKKDDLDLDEDVIAEEDRITHQTMKERHAKARANDNEALLWRADSSEVSMDVIRVAGFRKAYTTTFGAPFLAVERISFGLDYGECFALLGVNGAGKTTLFKSLTRDIEPSEGSITIAGFDVQSQFGEARKLIGYCPQHDAIFALMTVEEHLWFYAKIKGIPADKRRVTIERAIRELNLDEHRKKPAGTLSGGNKRKL